MILPCRCKSCLSGDCMMQGSQLAGEGGITVERAPVSLLDSITHFLIHQRAGLRQHAQTLLAERVSDATPGTSCVMCCHIHCEQCLSCHCLMSDTKEQPMHSIAPDKTMLSRCGPVRVPYCQGIASQVRRCKAAMCNHTASS